MFKVNEYFDGTVKSIAFGMAVPLSYLSSNKKAGHWGRLLSTTAMA